MKTKLKKNLDVFSRVMDTMERHQKVWANVPMLNKAYDTFVENYKKLTDAVKIAEEELEPIRESRYEIAANLRQSCLPFIGVLHVLTKDAGEKKIPRKLLSYEKQLKNASPNGVLKISRFILALVAKHTSGTPGKKSGKNRSEKSSPLNEYGISAEMLNELKAGNKALEEASQNLKAKSIEIITAKKQVKKLTEENKRLLNKRIARIMNVFAKSQPDFYNEFRDALKLSLKEETPKEEAVNGKR